MLLFNCISDLFKVPSEQNQVAFLKMSEAYLQGSRLFKFMTFNCDANCTFRTAV